LVKLVASVALSVGSDEERVCWDRFRAQDAFRRAHHRRIVFRRAIDCFLKRQSLERLSDSRRRRHQQDRDS
jgi:hypothetical protein